MDLLFKQYASPFSYIDTLIEMDMLFDGVKKIYESSNDDKLWDLYLHSNRYISPEMSYDKWMDKAKQKAVSHQNIRISKKQAEIMLKDSEQILSDFHFESR